MELKRICKHIAENRISEAEMYEILESYQKKLYHFAWMRGYRLSELKHKKSKYAESVAERKNNELSQDRMEDPLPNIDFSKSIKSGTIIFLWNGDEKPVEYIQKGDFIFAEGKKEVKSVKKTDKGFLISWD